MKVITLISAFCLFLFFSCSENGFDEPNDEGLNGKWNLISVSCFCEPVNLEKGDQIWYIDTVQNKLKVINNVTEDLHTILDSGDYSINIDYEKAKIEIMSVNYDYWFQGEDLYLGYMVASDGPLILFKRD